ncbi:hypothetical protein Dshi_0234 [Dinoroseobacter shibae DFL 12 = DSM 16493]|jgi:hypothetical protein|uniref:Hedgehog/Intein (Hint) domain-containing protein n=1 Tax=Dinoroseobacter shibae (strain DSM 16493 / NCIMB 14021 / DFL 12) TaxID=398580 RepID=A8LLH3_DINSH|nr:MULTISPECIES: Hint domain-containing protein [Dinoroseobacter]ABV91983.1 hypothetical protein Dshi_0234 [Dinoroseobacter shibae DFL 12 = DSM 16493]MDD9718974.1 Hint domain-containing protein [Dinoroseobacter sp. PD6]URF46953.1 Hint domain-containing protein [Dinoroseobacter shibae]URF51264.1 Hint domain-containing protein [Dinoroseobacter shibae]
MARISEMHYSDVYSNASGVSEFLELALDPSEDPADFTASFYNHDGTALIEIPLDHPDVRVSFDADSGENVYVISQDDFVIRLTDPDGGGTLNAEAAALTDHTSGTVHSFFDIGGETQNITALDGAAQGAVSVNVWPPTGAGMATYSIQWNQPDPTTPVFEPVDPGDTGMCFTPGTRIDTPDGPRPVEHLRPGDLVLTRDAGAQPLVWTGARRVPAAGVLAPVAIPVGVHGATAPLLVSPQHRILVTGWQAELLTGAAEVLVAALHLVDGDRVVRRPGGMVTYVHILFDRHQIVRANGAWSESFHPGAQGLDTMAQASRDELLALFPELAADPAAYGPSARPTLRAHEARLLCKL